MIEPATQRFLRMSEVITELNTAKINVREYLSTYLAESYGIKKDSPDISAALERLLVRGEEGVDYYTDFAESIFMRDVDGVISNINGDLSLRLVERDEAAREASEEHIFDEKDAGELYSYFQNSVKKNDTRVTPPDDRVGLLIPNRAPVSGSPVILVTANAMSGVASIYDKEKIELYNEILDNYLISNRDRNGNNLDMAASIKLNENLRAINGVRREAVAEGRGFGGGNPQSSDEITKRENALISNLTYAQIPPEDRKKTIDDFHNQTKELHAAYLQSINDATQHRLQTDPAVKRALDQRVALHAKNLSNLAKNETSAAQNITRIKDLSDQLSGHISEESKKPNGTVKNQTISQASSAIKQSTLDSLVNGMDATALLTAELPSYNTENALRTAFQLPVASSSKAYDAIYAELEKFHAKKAEDLLKEANIDIDPNDTQLQRQDKIDKLQAIINKAKEEEMSVLSDYDSLKKDTLHLASDCLSAVNQMPIDQQRKAAFVKAVVPVVEGYDRHEETHQPTVTQIRGVISQLINKKQQFVENSSEKDISGMGELEALKAPIANKIEIALAAASIREAENSINSVESMKARGVNSKGIIDSAIAQSSTVGAEYLSQLMIQRQKELRKISFDDVMRAYNAKNGDSKDIKRDELSQIINLAQIFNEGTSMMNSATRTSAETKRDIEHNEKATQYAANHIIFEAGKDGKLHQPILRYNGKVDINQQTQEYAEKARLAGIALSDDKVDAIHTGFFGPSAKLKANVDKVIFRQSASGEMQDGLYYSDTLKNALRKSNNSRDITNLVDETISSYLSDIGSINRVATDSSIAGGTVSPEVIKKLANIKELSVALDQDLKTIDPSDIGSSEKRADALQRSAALRELMVRELSQVDADVAKARGVCAQGINKQRSEEKTKTTILMLLCAVASVALTIAAIVTGIEGDIDQSKANQNPNSPTPPPTSTTPTTPSTTSHKTVDPTTLVSAADGLQSIPVPPHFTLPQPPPTPPPVFVAANGQTFNPYTSPNQLTAGVMASFAKNPSAVCTNWQALEASPSANTFMQYMNTEVPIATQYVSSVTSAVQSLGTSLSNNGFHNITPQAETNAVNTIINSTNTLGKNGQETIINKATYDLDEAATYVGMSGLVMPPKTFLQDAQKSTQFQQAATYTAQQYQGKMDVLTSKYDLPTPFDANKANPFTTYFSDNKDAIISQAQIYAPQAVKNAQDFAAQKAEYPSINAIPETVQEQVKLYNQGVDGLASDMNTAMAQNANKNGNTVTPAQVTVDNVTASDFTMAPNNYQQQATANTTASIVTGTMAGAIALGAIVGYDSYRPQDEAEQKAETEVILEDELPDREVLIENVPQKVAYTSKDGAPMGEKIFPKYAKPVMEPVERAAQEQRPPEKKLSTPEDKRDYFATAGEKERREMIEKAEAERLEAESVSAQSAQAASQPKKTGNWMERLNQSRMRLQDTGRQY